MTQAAAPASAPATFSFFSFLQGLNVQSIEAEVEAAEKYAPFALALMPAEVRAKIAVDASFIMGICAALGGTLPGQTSSSGSGGAP